MNIQTKKISELVPAPYNPRKISKKELESLKRSIKEFGYVEPVIFNKATGYVVGGHQRLKALQDLGIKEVECVIIDVPPEKEKALNIALNKISGTWEKDKLFNLLDGLDKADFDISLTGFDFLDLETFRFDLDVDTFQDSARELQFNSLRMNEYDENRAAGYYQMPILKACHFVPDELVAFKYIRNIIRRGAPSRYSAGVHFFIYDWEFERIWNEPYKYIDMLKNFSCVLTPDFSLYLNMPMAMKVWNVFRSHLIGQIMQDNGLTVIPKLQWAEPETFDFCFDGIEGGGTVAVSTRGILQDKNARSIWKAGMDTAIEKIKPETILCYGSPIDYDFKGVKAKYIKPRDVWE